VCFSPATSKLTTQPARLNRFNKVTIALADIGRKINSPAKGGKR
jgi:hypothetical protein